MASEIVTSPVMSSTFAPAINAPCVSSICPESELLAIAFTVIVTLSLATAPSLSKTPTTNVCSPKGRLSNVVVSVPPTDTPFSLHAYATMVPSLSVALASSVTLSPSVIFLSNPASTIGASLTAFISMAMFAMFEPTVPSFTLKLKLSLPL